MESRVATREEVFNFLSITTYHGYGDGVSSGYGCGDGVSSGYGCGLGYGDGFGDGDGVGDGVSSGSGCGLGYGYGLGIGFSCNGFGTGYGYYDIKTFCGYIVDYIDVTATIITKIRGNIAVGYIIKKDMTLEPCYIAKVGNSFAHGNTIKEAVADAEAKELERMPIEERVKKFIETFGTLDSQHTGKEFYDWHHILTGSCRMGRDEFCKSHSISMEKIYTVKYFLEITKEAYGGDVINQVLKIYQEN